LIGAIKRVKPLNIPIVSNNKSVVSFLKSSFDLSKFVYYQISEVRMNDNKEIVVYLINNSTKIFIGKEDFEKKIVVLENFLKQNSDDLEFKNVEYIDLRFDKNVIVKENNIKDKDSTIVNNVTT